MNILITSPSLAIHGGIRVLAEWANGLSRLGHNVTLQIFRAPYQDWVGIDPAVKVVHSNVIPQFGHDIIVATMPTLAIQLDQSPTFAKKFYLLQMAEDLFEPDNARWVTQCRQSYKVRFPIIGISKWVEEHVRQWRGDLPMHYVGNGVSDDFKPGKKDDGLTILVEGWGGYPGNTNKAKDVDMLGPRVAKVLHDQYGAKIIAFSQFPLNQLWHAKEYEHILSEYHEAPTRDELIRLYQRPTFMLKASKYDARSCAPVEAMKCGTVTVRAIERGDDDLIGSEGHSNFTQNSMKVGYNFNDLLDAATMAIDLPDYLRAITQNMEQYARTHLDWKTRIEEIKKILING